MRCASVIHLLWASAARNVLVYQDGPGYATVINDPPNISVTPNNKVLFFAHVTCAIVRRGTLFTLPLRDTS